MSDSPSIVVRVGRTYVTGLALAAVSIVVVSAIVGSGVVVWRDDQSALALGHLLATELEDHADAPSTHDEVVRHELAEQHWFARRIEVWREGERVGGVASEGTLSAYAGGASDRCVLTRIAGSSERVCTVRAQTNETIVVASELGPMLAAMLPMLLAVALVALVVTWAFGLIGRRALASALAPLSRFEAEVAAIPARARPRNVTRAWGSSELDSLAATFDAMLARIDEARAREQRFVSDAAHELRTPLTRLRGQLELAREELREGKPIDARLAASVKTAIELASTTEALLAMAQGTSDHAEPIELEDVIDDVVARLGEGERRRVRIVPGGQAIADGVEPLVVLAAGNLIDNALKHGAGPVEVTWCDDALTSLVTIEVSDEGPGIPVDELDRIREPFVRGVGSRDVRGTGLGLALVDHVARLHGGSLALENREPRGLCATLAVRRWRAA